MGELGCRVVVAGVGDLARVRERCVFPWNTLAQWMGHLYVGELVAAAGGVRCRGRMDRECRDSKEMWGKAGESEERLGWGGGGGLAGWGGW